MKLKDILCSIHGIEDDLVIYAKKPWCDTADTLLSPATAIPIDNNYEYFLEVFVAKEALEVFEGREISDDDLFKFLIFYAENDAYPEWVYL